jgi:hypothetical protein
MKNPLNTERKQVVMKLLGLRPLASQLKRSMFEIQCSITEKVQLKYIKV